MSRQSREAFPAFSPLKRHRRRRLGLTLGCRRNLPVRGVSLPVARVDASEPGVSRGCASFFAIPGHSDDSNSSSENDFQDDPSPRPDGAYRNTPVAKCRQMIGSFYRVWPHEKQTAWRLSRLAGMVFARSAEAKCCPVTNVASALRTFHQRRRTRDSRDHVR